MASLTGQSWRVLKSWYGRPTTNENLGAVSQKFLAGVWLRYVCNAGYFFIAATLFGAVVHHSRTEFAHPRRPRGSQSGREKRRDESFQVRAKEPLGTDSYQTISKISSGCCLLIGHKKCFVLFCPMGEQFLLSYFREFVHDG